MHLFDSHCHLDDHVYDEDREAVIKRAAQAGVKAIMVAGISLDSCRRAIALADMHAPCYASAGIHPHDAKGCSEEVLAQLIELARHPKVCAWGEIGLDYNRMYSPLKAQEKWFIRQLDIAQELDLPVIFHERDTNGRFTELLKAHASASLKGVIHCFSGNAEELNTYLQMGLYIGVTGILTIKKRGRNLRQLVRRIPANRLLIETDAPYLTPAPEKNRHRRNEPAFVKSVLLKLADVRGDEPESLADAIWENTCQLYRIPCQTITTSLA
jgi:TatD DNase family protein